MVVRPVLAEQLGEALVDTNGDVVEAASDERAALCSRCDFEWFSDPRYPDVIRAG